MPFDVQSARKAGYSDDEILSHLTQSRKFDVSGAVKAGYSKPDIIAHLSGSAVSTVGVSAPGVGAKIGQGVSDFVEGFGSGVLSTIFHGGDLLRRATGAERIIDKPEVRSLMRAPDSAAGKAGSFVEQGLEFAAPSGIVSKGAKLLQGTSKTGQIAGRAGLEALSAAGVAGVQTGGDAQAMRNAALTAGGVTAGTGALAAAAPAVVSKLKTGAAEQYSRVLNPTKEGNKFIAEHKVVPEALKRGVMSPSMNAIRDRARAESARYGAAIDDWFNTNTASGVTAQVGPIFDKLDDAAQELYYVKTTSGALKPLTDDVAQQGIRNLEALKNSILGLAEKNPQTGILEVPVATMRKLRQHFDKIAAKAGAFNGGNIADQSAAHAYELAGDAVREGFAQNAPDLAKINKEFSFWKNLGDLSEKTATRRVGQAKPLRRMVAGMVGGSAGAATGDPMMAVVGAVAADKLQQLVMSPAWGTVSAVTKDRLAKALAKGSKGEAEFYIRKALASAGAAAATGPR